MLASTCMFPRASLYGRTSRVEQDMRLILGIFVVEKQKARSVRGLAVPIRASGLRFSKTKNPVEITRRGFLNN